MTLSDDCLPEETKCAAMAPACRKHEEIVQKTGEHHEILENGCMIHRNFRIQSCADLSAVSALGCVDDGLDEWLEQVVHQRRVRLLHHLITAP